MVRAFTGIETQRGSGRIEWSEWENISSAVWTDPAGSGRGVCTVTHPDPAAFRQVAEASHLLIVPTGRELNPAPVYGPYRIRPAGIEGGSGDVVASGEIAPHFGALIAESGAYASQIAPKLPFRNHGPGSRYPAPRIEAFPPISDFGADSGGIGMGGQLYNSLLFNAASQVATLADAASAFAAFGLAVWPRTRWNGISQAWETVAEVDGLYPLLLAEGDGRRYRSFPYVDAVNAWSGGAPSGFMTVPPNQPGDFAWPDDRWHVIEGVAPTLTVLDKSENEPGAWRRRRQVGAVRRVRDDVLLQVLQIGDSAPTELLEDAFATPTLLLDAALQRWRWQNSAARLSFSRIVPDDYPPDAAMATVPVLPRQLVTVPEDWLEDWLPESWRTPLREWRVESVQHRFGAEEGYVQVIEASLWQGPYVHVSPQTQHEPF